jgi:hypothetical protein
MESGVKRRTVVVDRISCAIAGGALVALGLAAAGWQRGNLHVPAGGALSFPWLPDLANSAWWPVALGVVAIIAILVGVMLLFSHRPGQTLGSAALEDSDASGVLTVDLNSAASAAASGLAGQLHVVAASGTTAIDRGQRVVELDVKIAPAPGALVAAVAAAEGVQKDLAVALEGVPFRSRILLRTSNVPKGAARVS